MSIITNSTSPAAFSWQPAAWLRVTGADAANFLQGQFTNDLSRGGAVYGLWLNVKGKVVADSFVLRGATPHEFWIGSYFSPAATIRERLESHIIADDVTIEDATSAWGGVTIFGPEVAPFLAASPVQGFVFRGRRSRQETAEWVFPLAAGKPVSDRLAGWQHLDAHEVARRRIDAAIPGVPFDIGPGDLPNEGGLQRDAISYTKGCYLGQEVMARLKSMGKVRRRLLRVRSSEEKIPARPAVVFAGGRQVGELRSAERDGAGFAGLAMLSLLHVSLGTSLSLAAGAAPTLDVIDSP